MLALVLLWFACFTATESFLLAHHHHGCAPLKSQPNSSDSAERLREKARALREEIAQAEQQRQPPQRPDAVRDSSPTTTLPPWSLPLDAQAASPSFRLYFDLGREPGTWMEPRWGASGQRLTFTLDVRFCQGQGVSKDLQQLMVDDSTGGTRSAVSPLQVAPKARLRQGFDAMKCQDGAYRIDTNAQGSQTARFYVQIPQPKTHGDVTVPAGPLHVSMPVFLGNISQLSRKEGLVSVRQQGWNTGWYRTESRIVGVVRAVPLDEAQKRDGF